MFRVALGTGILKREDKATMPRLDRYDIAPEGDISVELGILIATLQDGTREWRENLETPPQEAMCWQPYPDGPSIGGLILHMASCEAYWLGKVVGGLTLDENDPAIAYDMTMDQYIPSWPIPPDKPLSWYYEIQDKQRLQTIAWIQAHDAPAAEYKRRESTFTYRWAVAHQVEHDSYHGGQAVLLHEMWKKLHAR